MCRISRPTAIVTIIALVLHGGFAALAATGATIDGTVEVPCDPSRVSEVAAVRIRSVAGESATTVPVDPATGQFVSPELTEGEYELMAIGADGEPLSPEPKGLVLTAGSNRVVLSMQPAGCGEPDTDLDGVSDAQDSCPNTPLGTAVGADGCPSEGGRKPGRKRGLKDWHFTLIYFGVVAAVILALSDDDEQPASPF